MDGTRCMTWREFKQSLDNMMGKKLLYVDEEGTEIPINSDAEFQEALRLAKKQGNRVRFVVVNEISDEGKRPTRQSSKPKEKYPYKETRHSKPYVNEEVKEAVYVNDAAPEWFVSYMKKFKKDLLAEVNITIQDAIRKMSKKEAKPYDESFPKYQQFENPNLMPCDGGDPLQYFLDNNIKASIFCVNTPPLSIPGNKFPVYVVNSQPVPTSGSARMRPTEKVYLDPMKDDRRAKQYVKLEKARLNSLDRRQKQDYWMNVPTVGHEERMKTSKSRAYPKVYISYVHDFGPMKATKSASFTSNLSLKKLEVLQPYALWFLLGNNGSVPWSNNAYVKCFYNPDEFEFEDNVIELPSLEPGVGANVVYEVTPLKVGSFSFTCAIIDNGVEIGERILCRFEVVEEEGMKIPKPTKVPASKKEAQQPCEHYDDEFTKTQKKIKENIKTIMKRLDDIEVLNSDSSSKGDSKKKEDDSVKVGQKRNRKKRKEGTTIEFRTGVFDLLQNLESIRENEEGKPKDEEKEIVKDKLVGTEDKQPVAEDKKEKQNENGKKKSQEDNDGSDGNQSTKDENKKDAADAERRDSDSELSVIMGSEEDDNFIVLSMPSRTPSPETQVKELENEEDKENKKEKEDEKEKEKGNEKDKEKEKEKEKENEAMQKESPPEEEKKSTFESNTFDPWNEKKNRESTRFDPWNEKSQPDPFDDGPKDNNEKRKKWGFHVVNFPEGATKINGTQFCFLSPNTKPEDFLAKLKNGNVNVFNKDDFILAQDDQLGGNVVFVVDKGGKCVPVVNGKQKESAETGKQKESAETGKQKESAETGKRQENAETKGKNDKEIPRESSGGASPEGSSAGSEQPRKSPDQSHLPSLLLYNAASGAVIKVVSAFNNIHSAFLPGGTEKPTLVEKMRPIRIMEQLGYLDNMGFTDRIRNRELLMKHNLNLPAVIEELLDTTPSARGNPPKGKFLPKQGYFGRF